MTAEERMRAMDAKIINDKKIKEEKERQNKDNIEMAMKDIEILYDRIKDIIKLGEYCRQNKIKYPNGQYYKYANGHNDFESDGIRHYFGFLGENGYCCHGGEIHVGWMNGGWCGDWDVHCDGIELWLQHHTQKNYNEFVRRNVDSIDIIHRFINDFALFESRFYEWFDNKCK